MSQQNPDASRAERAAGMRAEEARKDRNRKIGLIAMIVVVVSAVVAAGAWYSSDAGTAVTSSHVAVAAGDGAVVVGKATAPVKITIYEDFLCPSCRELEDSTRDYLRANAADGKVQVTYRPINLLTSTTYSERALNAWAAVLKNGTPTEALALHDLLFENQPYETDAGATTDAAIARLVRKAGATGSAVTSALGVTDSAFLAAAQQTMATQKITGTPTIFLNGKALAAASVTDLVTQLEAAVDAAS